MGPFNGSGMVAKILSPFEGREIFNDPHRNSATTFGVIDVPRYQAGASVKSSKQVAGGSVVSHESRLDSLAKTPSHKGNRGTPWAIGIARY